MSDPTSVVKTFVHLLQLGKMAEATAMLSPNVVIHHNTRLPYKGFYRGRQGFAQLLEKIGAFWETFIPGEGTQHIRDEDGVVIIGKLSGKPRHVPDTISVRVLERYEVDNGQIVAIWPFYIDTHLSDEQARG